MGKWMVKENIFGLMEVIMKEIILIILKKVMENLNGLMGKYMKDLLKMGNLMVLVS